MNIDYISQLPVGALTEIFQHTPTSNIIRLCTSNKSLLAKCTNPQFKRIMMTTRPNFQKQLNVDLVRAISSQQITQISLLLKLGADPNYIYTKQSMLQLAINTNNIAIIKGLLDNGAIVTDSDLFFAIYTNPVIVTLLLDHGANPNARHPSSPYIKTPLDLLSESRSSGKNYSEEMGRLLYAYGGRYSTEYLAYKANDNSAPAPRYSPPRSTRTSPTRSTRSSPPRSTRTSPTRSSPPRSTRASPPRTTRTTRTSPPRSTRASPPRSTRTSSPPRSTRSPTYRKSSRDGVDNYR
jgi:hypothetical protein